MYEMVMNPQLGAFFVALLLVKLNDSGQLEVSVTVYQPGKKPYLGQVTEGKPAQSREH